MNALALTRSIRTVSFIPPCPECGAVARLHESVCVSCLLRSGLLDGADDGAASALATRVAATDTRENLDTLLAQLNVRDCDWQLGNYHILEEIGRGGMGVIYRARQRHSKRIVALKRLLSYHGDSRETLERFRREAEAAASLDHPNILPIYEVGEEEGLPYFTMKYAAGGSLQQLASALRDDPRECVRLVMKITRAVSYAHSEGILHRDIKPGNILLDGRGEPMVSDFGLAKWLDHSTDLTRTLTVFGTPGFVAPEQAHSAAVQLTPAADVYSIGALLFGLLAGRPPFLGEHALSVIKQAEEKPAPKLRSLVRSADRDLETICAKCLERQPEQRYHAAADLAEDLQRWLEGRPILARPVNAPARLWRWAARNQALAAAVATCIVLTAVAASFAISNGLERREVASARHSIVVEPVLDLDSGRFDSEQSKLLARAFQEKFSRIGPARVSVAGTNSGAARLALRGTQRLRAGKLRCSLQLITTARRDVVARRVVEAELPDRAAETMASTTAAEFYAILDQNMFPPAEEPDPGWRDASTRDLLIAGKAVQDRHALVDIIRAIDLFRDAVNAQPRSALAHSFLSEAQWAYAEFTGNRDYVSSAEVAARKALELDPANPEAHKAASMAFLAEARFGESLDHAFTALELANTSDDYRLINRITGNLRLLGHPENALPWYRLTFKTGMRPYESSAVGDCYLELGDYARAAAEYKRTASLFPEHPEGWIGLCRVALLQKDFATAQRIASENWQRYREFAFSQQMVAQVEFFSRNYDKAARLYQELAANDPNGGGSFYGAISYASAVGRLRQATGDAEGATNVLEAELEKERKWLELAPQHPQILYRVAALESCLGSTDAAFDHLRSAIGAGWIDYRSLDLDPRFDGIRQLPIFHDLIAGLEQKVGTMRDQAQRSSREETNL